MSHLIKKTGVIAFALASTFALAACDVDKTQEGEMPDVEVQGGQLPQYDVDAPDVEVDTKDVTVPVPDVDIEPADADDPNT